MTAKIVTITGNDVIPNDKEKSKALSKRCLCISGLTTYYITMRN